MVVLLSVRSSFGLPLISLSRWSVRDQREDTPRTGELLTSEGVLLPSGGSLPDPLTHDILDE